MRRCRCFVFGHAAVRNDRICSDEDNNAGLKTLDGRDIRDTQRARLQLKLRSCVCFCSLFKKLTSRSACLCMLFQTGLNYLLLVQHVHTTSGQDSREKNCGLAHTTVIPFALPLGPDSSEKLYVLQTHFNHSSRPDHDCTLGHPCSHCI